MSALALCGNRERPIQEKREATVQPDTRNKILYRGARRTYVLLFALFLMMFATAVYAATATINTDDGAIDSNWADVAILYDDPDNDSLAPSDAELDKVWIANNGARDTFYFRADSLVAPADTELIAAKLDCNQNGAYTDPADVIVLVDAFQDIAFECQGNTYNGSCYQDQPQDNNGTAASEEINVGNGAFTHEWSGSTAGNVDWSSCLDTINVQFAAVLISDYAVEDDVTEPQSYNVITAVSFQSFAARGPSSRLLLLAGLCLALGTGAVLYKGWR